MKGIGRGRRSDYRTKNKRTAARVKPRLCVEALEDRCLLDAGSSTFKFEFGTPFSPVVPGWTGVSPLSTYAPSPGYGWTSSSTVYSINLGTGDPLTQTSDLGPDATFLVDLPNGDYNVTAIMGGALLPMNNAAIWAEGQNVVSGLSAQAGQIVQPTFQTQVADGQLSLRFTGSWFPGFRLDALTITPAPAPTPTPTPAPTPPLTDSAGGPYTGQEGAPVTLTATAAGGTGPYTYAWDFDGSGRYATAGQSVSQTFSDNGVYTVGLKVTDGAGTTATTTATVNVANVAPTAQAGGPYTATVGQPLTLHGSATDPSPADTAVGFTDTWDFGDGTPPVSGLNLTTPTHTYASAGTYTVKVTATDKDQATSTPATATVTVTAVAPPAGAYIQALEDSVPNFGYTPTVTSIASGNWSSPSTWSTGVVPGDGAVVDIQAGTTVTYDIVGTAHIKTVAINSGGTLRFRTDTNTQLIVGNFEVLSGGYLEIGTVANPVAANVTAKVIIANQAIDTTFDPSQYGTGLLVMGKISVCGATKSNFIQVASEMHAGDSVIHLSAPETGWKAGDQLILPDTRHLNYDNRPEDGNYVTNLEQVTIQSVSADGMTVTLTAPMQFDHLGAHNMDGVLVELPDVSNLTRNVVFSSENPNGIRGHTMYLERADVDLRYAQFYQLGRTTDDPLDSTTFDSNGQVTHLGTNQKGRYALHIHHLMGPVTPQADGYQFTLVGNSVDGGVADNPARWGITVHGSSWGLIQDNLVYNVTGAGVMTEDGSESYNLFKHNMVIRVAGTGQREDSRGSEFGFEGAGYWFRGPNNYVVDNVANEVRTFGFDYFLYVSLTADLPRFQGADLHNPANLVSTDMNALPLLQFQGNRVYGATLSGMTIWDIGTREGSVYPNMQTSQIKDFTAWNLYGNDFLGYASSHVTVDNMTVYGDPGILRGGNSWIALTFQDYFTDSFVLKNSHIEGMAEGIRAPTQAPSPFIVENTYFRCWDDLKMLSLWSSAASAVYLPNRQVVVRDCVFDTNLPGIDGVTVFDMAYMGYGGSISLTQLDQLFVYNYNQVAGDNFQVFYSQQTPDFIMPVSALYLNAAPVAGLTNQQLWAQYKIAVAGAVTPTTATKRNGIDGLINPI